MARDSTPQPDVPLFTQAGGISKTWYDYFLSLKKGGSGMDFTAAIEALQRALAGKQPLNANLSAISVLVGAGLLQRDSSGTWSLTTLSPDDIPNPFATYLVDHNGDYLTDPDGNYLVSDDGIPVPLEYGGTGASLADPNADRLLFWDDSFGAVTWLAPGSTLSVTGTTFDISTAYVGQASITTLGTIGTGVWQGSVINPAYLGVGSNTSALFLRGDGVWTSTLAGNLTVSASTPLISLVKPSSGQDCAFVGWTGATPRWTCNLGDSASESGSNAGSNFRVDRYADAGSYIGQVFTIYRDSGNAKFDYSVGTGTPSGGTSKDWRLGKVTAGAVALDTANYVEVEIDGVAVKLLKAT